MAVEVGSAVGYLDLDISGFLAGLKEANEEAGNFAKKTEKTLSEKLQSSGQKISSVGKTLTAAVTLPIAGLGTAAVKTTADFESAMSKVSAISGAAGNDLESLTDKAKEMGAKTKFSATESAEAFQYMAMAGWKTEAMIDGIDGIMALAAADGLDLATTSDIVTDALTAFGLSASDSAHFADVLAKASSAANTNVSMLGESFKYVAPVAGSLGYSAEDTAIALGLMANAGIKASQGGTALRGALSKMIKPSDDAAAIMDKYNLSLTNSDGSMKSLGEVMDMLRTKMGGLSEAEQAQAAATLFGQEAMSGMLAIINASEKDYSGLTDAIYDCDGAAQQMADVQLDNLSGQITILKSTLEGLAIQFGEIILPYVKDFVTWLQNLAQKFSELSPQQQEMIVKLATFAVILGPLILIIGKLTSGIGSIISLFGKFGSAASAAAKPVASSSSAVGGLAQSAKGLLAAGAGILLAGAGLSLLAQSSIALVEAGWPAIAVMGGMVVALVGLGAGAAAIAPALTAGSVGLYAFGGAVALVGVGVLAASAGIALLATQLPVISEHGGQAALNITALGGAVTVFAAGMLLASGSLTTFSVSLLAVGAGLVVVGTGAAVAAVSCGLLFVAVKGTASSVESIEKSAKGAAKSLKEMVTSVDVVKEGLEGLGALADRTVSAFVNVFKKSKSKSNSEALSLSNGIKDNIKKGLADIPNDTNRIMDDMNKGVSSGMTKMNGTIKQGFSVSTAYIRSLKGQAYTWGADIIQGISNGIYSKLSVLRTAVNSAANVIHANLHFSVPDEGPLTDYETWMPDFMEGLAKGIYDNSYKVKSAMQSVADDMVLDVEPGDVNAFSESDTKNLKSYNVTLASTVDLFKQLVEQMSIYSTYSGIVSGDNNLFKSFSQKVEVERTQSEKDSKSKSNENTKPDVLNIPIMIGDEQIENVVVDLLRREVRT